MSAAVFLFHTDSDAIVGVFSVMMLNPEQGVGLFWCWVGDDHLFLIPKRELLLCFEVYLEQVGDGLGFCLFRGLLF